MDDLLRRRAREANDGDPHAAAAWVKARRRAGEVPPVPRDGDRIHGRLLGALLVSGLDGRREVDVLRDAGVAERQHSRLIDALRGLARGEVRTWSAVRPWAVLLGLDLSDLALVAEVEPRRLPRPRAPASPHPLTTLPERACCGRCRFMLWAVGIGGGVRCGNAASTVGLGGLVPGLHQVCGAYEGPRFDAPPA